MSKPLRVVGQPGPRVEAIEKVTGSLKYADDLFVPNMLVGKLLRSTQPHAKIVRIDVSEALAMPGVKAVITGRDLPVAYGIMPRGEDEHALAQDKVRYVGDPVAAVAAVDEVTAAEACRRIKVEYEPLPRYMGIKEALEIPAAPIHDYTAKYTGNGNIHKVIAYEFGDLAAGFEQAEHIREDVIYFEGNTHMPLEQHACLAEPHGRNRVTLHSSTQNPHYVWKHLAKVLEMPHSHVRVVAVPIGGGFGGKCDPFPHEITACKLAMVTGQPVKMSLTREEVFYTHRGRHPVLFYLKTGFKKDGTIVAQEHRSYVDGGAHASYGVASIFYTGVLNPTTYRIPAWKFDAVRVFTNKPPCGPKRGHGTVQPRFALEVHLDKVAEELGLSPVEIRLRNLIEPFSKTVNHLRITSCGLKECIDQVLAASNFENKHRKLPHGKGVGFAVSAYMSGAGLPIYWNDMDHSQVWVRCDRFGGVTVYTGVTEIGQGSHTVHAFIVAEILGISPDDITIIAADSAAAPVDLGSYSSRVTFMSGNAARQAAGRMRQLLSEVVAVELECAPEDVEFERGHVYNRHNPDRSLRFDQACWQAETQKGNVITVGSYKVPPLAGPYKGSGAGPSPAYSFTAAVVQVDVDPDTGETQVEKVWIAHDIGKAIAPSLAIGQVEGSVYMGLCEALMEESAFKDAHGVHRIPSLLEYKTFTALDMPEVEVFLIETDDPEGPFGAKEVGQGPLLPVIPALANAVYDAVGMRIDEVPISPDKISAAMENERRGREPRHGPGAPPAFPFRPPTRVAPPDPQVPVLPVLMGD